MAEKQTISEIVAHMQQYIKPLNMNGLQGRMLVLRPVKKLKRSRNILMIYGHHASLERMYGIAEALSDYGTVTMPDLPGCGGMDSYYKIGITPSVNSMADYLAAFIKLRYRNNKKITIVAMSLGFVIITRMLQRYPELVSRVELLVSLVGFAHKYDYTFSKPRKMFYLNSSRLFARKLPSLFFYNVILHPGVIRTAYGRTHNAKKKFEGLSPDHKRHSMDFEVSLWRDNDVRTYMRLGAEMLTIDNCKVQVDLPVHHITVDNDQYFEKSVVEQHLRVIFTDYFEHIAVLNNHAPSILASKTEAAPLIPASIKKVLAGNV